MFFFSSEERNAYVRFSLFLVVRNEPVPPFSDVPDPLRHVLVVNVLVHLRLVDVDRRFLSPFEFDLPKLNEKFFVRFNQSFTNRFKKITQIIEIGSLFEQ